MEGFGLKSLKGSDGEVNVHEDVSVLARGWKQGDSIPFTATLNAAYDPEKQNKQSAADGGEGAVDAEVVAEKEA